MNKFRTEIIVKQSRYNIDYNSKIITIGSCFSENIGNLLSINKFSTLINPFGILYNPYSIKECLNKIIDNYIFKNKDLIQFQDKWYSFYHHGKFSDESHDILLEKINLSINNSNEYLKKADYILITFGSAYVYEYINESLIVANCHKIPSKSFRQYMLDLDNITNLWFELINKLTLFNPNIKIIFTVSPIRYLKYGIEMNQLSKSILIVMINKLKNNFSNIDYFSSYEIFMDDLRDYRFYKSDMIHPSDFAIDYIWEKFSQSYFNQATTELLEQIKSIILASKHKPRNPSSKEHKKFLESQINKIESIKSKYNFIDFSKELECFN